MAVFGPGTTTALAAGFEGAGLAERLRAQQMERMRQQQIADGEMKKRQAQQMIGQVLQEIGIKRTPPGQTPQVPTLPGATPGAPAPGATPTTPSGPTPPGGGPAPAQPPTGVGGQNAAPTTPQEMPEQGADNFSWRDVMAAVRQRTGADPETIYLAMQELMPQLEKESDRDFKAAQQREMLDQKDRASIANLQWRYYNTNNALERTQIMAEMRRITTEMNNRTQMGVAGINAGSRENVAKIQGQTQRDVASTNAGSRVYAAELAAASKIKAQELGVASRERINETKVALEKELKGRALDINADKVGKDFLVRTRALELQELGMEKKDAQFYAQLEVTKAHNEMRDETTRRGQDMVARAKADANLVKTDAVKYKATNAMEAAQADLDRLAASAAALLDHPGLEDATGPIESRLPTLKEATANFEADLKTLRSQTGLGELAGIKALSTSGASGLGAVSNFEMQQLQNKLASLELSQGADNMRKNLLAVIDAANGVKNRLLTAYERQFTPKATGAPGGVQPPAPGAASIDTPAQLADEPDGTVFRMGGKTYTKQGNKSVESGG